MSGRLALMLSILAVGAAAGSLVLLGNKLRSLTLRVAALEQKPAPPAAAPAPPTPAPAPPSPESPEAAKRKKVLEIAEKENQVQLESLVKELALDSRKEVQLRAAFIEEFQYYAEGVARALEALERDDPGSSLLTQPEFREGLEERIAAADEKVRALLNSSQASIFEGWRRALRKDRYELD